MNPIWDNFRKTFSGPIRGDCCSHNIYEAIPHKPVTVREMCEYILSTNEWGYIGIKCPGTIFGDPCVEYYEHQYVDKDRNPIRFQFPSDIANAVIKKIDWDGGWSRGDWLFTLY